MCFYSVLGPGTVKNYFGPRTIKNQFFHPMWYDLAVMEGLSTNSARIVDWLSNHLSLERPKHACTLNTTVRLLCNSFQSHHIRFKMSLEGRIYFRYDSYSAIYLYILELFFYYPKSCPLSSSIFILNLKTFWSMFFSFSLLKVRL